MSVATDWTRRLRRPRRSAAADVDWRADTFVVIDLETTGLDARHDHVVSYGAVPIRAGRVMTSESVYGLVHVPGDVPGSSIMFHGLRTQDLDGAPPLADCVATLDGLIGEHPVVAHCAWIERSFLRKAFRRSYLSFTSAMIDTAVLARRVLEVELDPGQAVSLEYAATELGLPVHSPHHALGDAVTTASLFLALAGRLERDISLTTAHLIALSEGSS
ncbi:DNA polymerase III subunit epsilon [Mycolicibacterium madagascariense]|uniref:DNA polymerase III subunit epsilon n=1 Tax=Mycolicibacterium madagascariense TaxID=212765 RepID=A0A7I7XEB7_9MYCO|nr:3'-5' exonuclease [Mycolicibacterium madagascariense]MCV7015204.1 3'-5' exonuclease [Mycolicibacterium madagascariense]BBZ27497.1 DNA polymerase III subunit epsilon [Mycolicibacterium madagascariense]